MKSPIQIYSEIGKLKMVLIKRPTQEIENLTPVTLEELLFDEIPYLPIIQEEHDIFAKVLRDNGVEILYLDELMEESIQKVADKEKFVDSFLLESSLYTKYVYEKVKDHLLSIDSKQTINTVMSGLRKDALKENGNEHKMSLQEIMSSSLFYLKPMPNLYFTRDPGACIGNGISINKMFKTARQRESFFVNFIMKNHPQFKDAQFPVWTDRDSHYSIEGGDILVLNEETIAIGISERTMPEAIQQIAKNVFKADNSFKQVLAVDIPKRRAFMHLDTVFTMLDKDKFSYHPEIFRHGSEENHVLDCFILEKNGEDMHIHKRDNLKLALKEVLKLNHITLIPCGGGDPVATPREQWSDGSNTLAIAPGVVITYDRNNITNAALREHGVKVLEIRSSELSRGRGGPRCMSMPIYRESI